MKEAGITAGGGLPFTASTLPLFLFMGAEPARARSVEAPVDRVVLVMGFSRGRQGRERDERSEDLLLTENNNIHDIFRSSCHDGMGGANLIGADLSIQTEKQRVLETPELAERMARMRGFLKRNRSSHSPRASDAVYLQSLSNNR